MVVPTLAVTPEVAAVLLVEEIQIMEVLNLVVELVEQMMVVLFREAHVQHVVVLIVTMVPVVAVATTEEQEMEVEMVVALEEEADIFIHQ